jgi:MFS family permease
MLVLTVTQALGRFVRGMVFPYASLYILALGGEPSQIGWINSVRPIAGLLVFPIAGYLADLAGRKRLIALTGVYSGLVILLYVVAPSWQVIALAGLLQGLAVFQFPATSAIIADSLTPENRGRGVAAMNTIAGTVATAAPYVAGALLSELDTVPGMRGLYATMMAVYLLNAGINARFLKETSSDSTERARSGDIVRVFREAYGGIPETIRILRGSLLGLAGVIILSFASNAIAGPYWVVYATERIGLSSTEWGLVLLIEAVLRNVAYFPAGMVVDRWGRTASMRTALLLALLTVPFFPFARGFGHVLVIRAAVALSTALFGPACSALLADSVPRETRGRVMAAIGRGAVMIGASAGGTGGPGTGYLTTIPIMVASVAGGYLYEWNPAVPWLVALALSLVAVALALFLIRDPQRAER